MFSPSYVKELGIEFIINYNRRSRQDEELERKTGEDTLKSQRDLMDKILTPLDVPYDQEDEIGSGDKISTRPVFQKVIADLEVGKYQAVAVKEISRLGRGSYTDMGVIYDLILSKRIFIITPWRIYDPKNPADLRQIRFDLFMSREEFETTRERLSGGRFNKANEGRWMAGKAPFGYSINSKSRRLDIHEEDAQIVRIIFDLFANGIIDDEGKRVHVRYRGLSSYLKKQGIKTPNGKVQWRPENLKYLLSNEVYIGTIKYRTTETINGKVVNRPESDHVVVENAHEPLIDLDTWNKAQAKAQDYSYKPRVKLDFKPYELTGLAVCKICGRKMIHQEQTQKYISVGGEETIYRKEFLWCTTSGCTFVKYRPILEDLLQVLHYFKEMDNDRVESVIKPLMTENKASKKNEEDTGQYVERKMKELKQRMGFIYEKYELGKYSDEMFDERKAEIESEMEKLKSMQLATQTNQGAAHEMFDAELVQKNLTSALDAYLLCDDRGDQNAILRNIFEHVFVEVLEKGSGKRAAKHKIYPVLKREFLRPDFLSI